MRLYEFESPLALFEDMSGEEMLQVFQTMHHDAGNNPEMDEYILSHNWELRNFTPDMFPDEEDFFDYDDPFNRVIDIDYSHRVNIADPIIVGPQYSDGKYSVIDGNHRAAAAQRAGKTIKGYFPVEQVNESLDNPYPISWVKNQSHHKIASAITPNGNLDISFESATDGEWTIYFEMNSETKATGAGDQFRVFSTVVAAIEQWYNHTSKNEDIYEIEFSSSKDSNDSAGRSKLYTRFAKQFAQKTNMKMSMHDASDNIEFVLTKNTLEETGMIFARKKGKRGGVSTSQKFTCSSGPRAGKRVSSLAQCFAPIDIAKRIQMKKTRAKTAVRQARRTKFTKRVDPSSLLTKVLNKARRPAKPKK